MKTKQSVVKKIIAGVEKSSIFHLVSSSFNSWRQHWLFIILSVVTDFLFVLGAGLVVTLVQFTLFDHLEAIMRLTGESTGGLMNVINQTAEVTTGMLGLSSSQEFNYHVNEIFKYLGIMVIAVFFIWIVFQGLSWYFAYRMSKEKRMPFLTFWKNFALQSLPFYILTVFWIFLSVKMLMSSKMSIAPLLSEGVINAIFAIIVIITWYFGSLCYTLDGKYAYRNVKDCFIFGFKRFFKIIQSILFLSVLFLVIDLFLRIGIIRGDPIILMLVGTVILMPAMVFARILLFKTTAEYWPVKKK